jgi:tetratricopeptide (TPR) repeat protein
MRKKTLVFWLGSALTFLMVYPTFSQTSSAALEAYGRGERLSQTGNMPAAIKQFEKAVRLAPENLGMRTHLAWLLLERAELREAVAHFQVLLEQKPDLKEAISGVALAEMRQGDLDGALLHLNQGLRFHARDPMLLRLKAEALAARPKTALQAVQIYDELRRLDPKNSEWPRQRQAVAQKAATTKYNSAVNFLKKGDRQTALREMEEALRFTPESLDYRTHYGWVLLEVGEPARGAQAFREVLGRDPKKYEALRGLAWAQYGQADFSGAINTARLGLESYPDDDQLLEIQADAAARPETAELAAETYRRLLARRPNDVALQVKYAKLLMIQWELDKAEKIFKEILAAEPGNIDARLGIARISMESRDFGAARAVYEKMVAAAPENLEARQGLEKAEAFISPQVETFGGYLEDSETFRRSHVYSSFRYYLTDQLSATLGYGYLVYDKGIGGSPPFREQQIHRHVLPLQLQYRPFRQLILEASGAFSDYGSAARSAAARASAYYQMTPFRGMYLYYSYYDVIDPSGPFTGPWGRHLDNFPDFGKYRYWVTDPLGTWAANIYGSSSTLSIIQHIRANEVGLWVYQDLFDRLTLSAYGAVGPYTDGNFRKTSSLAAYYRLVTDPLLFKFKYSFYYLGYRSRSASLQGLPAGSLQLYFDPIAFKNHSLGFVLEKNFSNWLKIVLESDLQMTPGAPSPGFLALGEIDVLLTQQLSLRMLAFYNHSVASDKTSYQVRTITAGLCVRF